MLTAAIACTFFKPSGGDVLHASKASKSEGNQIFRTSSACRCTSDISYLCAIRMTDETWSNVNPPVSMRSLTTKKLKKEALGAQTKNVGSAVAYVRFVTGRMTRRRYFKSSGESARWTTGQPSKLSPADLDGLAQENVSRKIGD